MTKTCSYCGEPFKDGETITVVAEVSFKLIPSRVHFALSMPSEVEEMFHRACYADVLECYEDLLGGRE